MAFIVKHEKKKHTPASEGLHPAVCCDMVDLGLVDSPWGKKPNIQLRWAVEEVDPTTNKQIIVRKRYNVSLHEKATLRKDLESWRGRKFTKEELEGFDVESIIGANCTLMISHNVTDDGDTFANVIAVGKPGKNSVKMRIPDTYTRERDREDYKAPVHEKEPEQDGHGNGSGFVAADEDIPF